MKKILTMIICFVAVASIAMAQTDVVYSVNVVGFQKVDTAPAGLTQKGMPFDAPDNEINNVIGTQLTSSKNYGGADKIIMWDPGSQTYRIAWFKNTDQWLYSDTGTVTTNFDLTSSVGFFVDSPVASTQEFTMVGDVVNVAAVTNTLVAGLNLISDPYGVDRSINELGINGTASKNYGGADKLIVWDVSSQTYKKYWYRNTLGPGWTEFGVDSVLTTDVVAGADGVWLEAINEFDWVSTRPYTID